MGLLPLSGDGVYPGDALVHETTEIAERKALMLSLAHFLLDLAGNHVPQVLLIMTGRNGGHLLLTTKVAIVFPFLPGYFDQLIPLPATGFGKRQRFFPFADQPLIHPCQLLVTGALPGFRSASGHIEETVRHLDISREELPRHLVPEELVGNGV